MSTLLITLLNLLGKPAIVIVCRWLEVKFPGMAPILETVIAYIQGLPAAERAVALRDLHKAMVDHCQVACPTDLK